MTIDITQFSGINVATETFSHAYEILFEKLKIELSKFGLTRNQFRVYLFLEKYGPNTARQVSSTLKMPRTETYYLLSSLQNSGIVYASFQKPLKFSALSLDKAMAVLINAEKERIKGLESQEKELVSIWNTIPGFKTKTDESKEDKFQMLQGINQMTGKINEIIINAKRELLILGSERDFMKFHHSGFLERISDSKVETKIVSSSSTKTIHIFKETIGIKVKKMPPKINENLCFIIKDDDELLLFLRNTNEPFKNVIAMWTNSPYIIYTMKLLFNYIWENSKYTE